MNKTKILFILPTFSAGGAENYALRFMKTYYTDFEFHVLSVSKVHGDLHDEFEVLEIDMYYQSIGYFDLKKAQAFYSFLKNKNYDTIVSFIGNFSGLALTIAKYAGVKNRIVFHRRSSNAFGKNPLKVSYNRIVNLLLRKNATLILSNSKTAFDVFYKGIYNNNPKFRIIRNGIDPTQFNIETSKKEARVLLNLPQEKYIIGHVGRYDPAKNHHTIFKVIRNLKNSCKNLTFVFCGKGTDSNDFLNEIKKYQLEDVVIILGMRRDLPQVYKSLDLFYFPSVTEGQPNALIEAMVSGVPVITSNIPPVLETLPSSAKSFSINPFDVDLATRVLLDFYKGRVDESLYIHQLWAMNAFDSHKRFNEFKNVLSKR